MSSWLTGTSLVANHLAAASFFHGMWIVADTVVTFSLITVMIIAVVELAKHGPIPLPKGHVCEFPWCSAPCHKSESVKEEESLMDALCEMDKEAALLGAALAQINKEEERRNRPPEWFDY